MEINKAWCVAATIAADLLCWLRLLCLDSALADAEPKTLRYRLLHTAARIVRGQRKRRVRPARSDLTTYAAHRPRPEQPHRPVEPAPRRDVGAMTTPHTRNEDHKRR